LHAFVHGELAFILWELFVLPEGCFVLCSFVDGVEPFCLPSRNQYFEHFVSVVLSCCLCLRGSRLALSSDLVFGFGLAFDILSEIFCSFFFFFFLF
jgi:hypothetical protein